VHYLLIMSPLPFALAQASGSGTTLTIFSELATVVIAIALIALLLVSFTILIRFNRAIEDLRIRAQDTIGPVSDRAKTISDNLEFITQSLRSDVEKLDSSIQVLSDRLNKVSGHIEDRIEDFSALIEVVQREVEELFLDTASTVRGFRAGAREMTSTPTSSCEEQPVAAIELETDDLIVSDAEGPRDRNEPEVQPPTDAEV